MRECHLIFNDTWIINKLLPTYTNIYIYFLAGIFNMILLYLSNLSLTYVMILVFIPAAFNHSIYIIVVINENIY